MQKVLRHLILLLLIVSAAQSQTVNTFEGVIEFKVQDIERVLFFNALIKGERMRVEATVQEDFSPTAILDNYDKKMYALLTATEQYVAHPLDDESTKHAAKIEQTGEQETIADFDCDQLIVTLGDREIEVWATKALGGIGGFMTALNLSPEQDWAWESQLRKLGYTPLRVVVLNNGYEEKSLDVINISRKSVGDASFRVPRQYEKVTTLAPPQLKPLQKKKK